MLDLVQQYSHGPFSLSSFPSTLIRKAEPNQDGLGKVPSTCRSQTQSGHQRDSRCSSSFATVYSTLIKDKPHSGGRYDWKQSQSPNPDHSGMQLSGATAVQCLSTPTTKSWPTWPLWRTQTTPRGRCALATWGAKGKVTPATRGAVEVGATEGRGSQALGSLFVSSRPRVLGSGSPGRSAPPALCE